MIKNECGQSGHRTVGKNCFFFWKSRKAKSYFNIFFLIGIHSTWIGMVKNGCGHLVHKTLI